MKYVFRTVVGLGPELGATKDGPVGVVQLDSNIAGLDPPWQYVVGYGSDKVQPGGPLLTPLVPE